MSCLLLTSMIINLQRTMRILTSKRTSELYSGSGFLPLSGLTLQDQCFSFNIILHSANGHPGESHHQVQVSNRVKPCNLRNLPGDQMKDL